MGRPSVAPVGFRDIRLRFRLDTDAGAGELARLEQLTERYCVVLRTLRVAPTVGVETTRVLTPRSRAPGGP